MPLYLTLPPQNPFELSKNEASKLGYPRNVRHLDIPEPQFRRDATLPRNISNDFFDDLVCSTTPIHAILRNYDRSRVNSLKYDIIDYFDYLQDRLRQQDLGYDYIVECDGVNYVSYGPRFWNWLSGSKLFNYDTLRSYSVLLYVYLGKFPWRILKLHEKLRDANLGLAKYQPKSGHFDYKMVSFKLLDLWPLHNSLKQICSLSEQQDHFISSVYFSNQPWRNFLIQELKKCLNYYEIDFLVLEIGALCNGASLMYRNFEFALAFTDDYVNIPDWSTLHLALKAIRKHLYRNYEIKANEGVHDDGLSFIKFDFGHLSRGYESIESHIYLDTSYVSTWSLIRFLSKCDNRFLEMTLVLNYWATSLCFYDQHFSCLSFVLMIVFALQQTSPPVFKPLDELICDAFSVHVTAFPLEREFIEDSACIVTSKNKQTTGELIAEFFRYYHRFGFEDYVISPYDGETMDKCDYYDDEDDIFISWISVQEPFNQEVDESIICKKKSMNQFRNCLSTYLTDLKLSSTNYLQVLTNPEYFNLKSDIYNRDRKFDNVPTLALNSPTVSTTRTDFEISSKSTSIESYQVDIKVVDFPVQVKEAKLIDLSPLPTSSEPKAEEVVSKLLVDFPKIEKNNNSTETLVKPSSPISSPGEKVNEPVEKCNEGDNEDQCRVM